MSSEEDRATTTGNMHKTLAKFGYMVFELCEQTDRQTDILITVLRNPNGVNNK